MAYENKTGLPSVTEIITATCCNWIPTDYFTDESRDRGTAVHEWCAAYGMGNYAVPLRKEWRGYCDSFKRWSDKYLVEILRCEERLVSSIGYCGQLDLACEIEGQTGVGVVDIKTGAHAIWHKIQVAAYRNLDSECGGGTKWGGVLRLKADGSMPIMDRTADNYGIDFNTFISCFNVFNLFK